MARIPWFEEICHSHEAAQAGAQEDKESTYVEQAAQLGAA
jgi:hypothetical protein